MASKENESAPTVEKSSPDASAPQTSADAPAAEKPAEGGPAPTGTEQPEAVPKKEDAETAAKRKADRLLQRREARKAARQKAKEAKAAGAAVKAASPSKVKVDGLDVPAGAVPKISVAKLPTEITVDELKAIFQPYGTILRAEVSKRRSRPTIGIIIFNGHDEVRRAFQELNGKHKCEGVEDFISIQYSRDSGKLGETLKATNDAVADCIKEHGYKPGVLRSRQAREFISRMVLARKKVPANQLIAAALLAFNKAANVQDLVDCKMINSASAVLQLLKSENLEIPEGKVPPKPAPRAPKAEPKAPIKALEKTFDAVVPYLDKLEQERWNLMAKANLRLPEHQRFRFVDILSTPSLELWRWMVEDCHVTPAEAATCFTILQKYYGFTK